MDSSENKANVGIPPPVIAFLLVGTGIGVHFAEPVKLIAGWQPALAIGLPILVIGIMLKIISIRVLTSEGTDMTFKKASTQIVRHGPYNWSRNPIYVSVLLEFVGLSFAINSFWLLAMTILQFLYFRFWVIAIEERYLIQKFGKKYLRYKSETRRWI
jgi:protein-S-isoprenylcysteine O-methyltransferase Ste14